MNRFAIVLVEPEIPPNTGSIGRTCVATQTPLHLVGPLGFSLEDRYLKRAGLDYWENVDLTLHSQWNDFMAHRERTRPASRLVMFTKRAQASIFDFEFRPDDLLIFGKETEGLPAALTDGHEPCLRIPTPGNVRSLNLAVAAGVALYEALRQQKILR